ncbi:MAG: hypothetical protein LBQ32_09855 [Burkholderiaceae bacterium]|jgi:hypothetical protein|nr:hypothetical protein [Burkholderiaceae bacterium]
MDGVLRGDACEAFLDEVIAIARGDDDEEGAPAAVGERHAAAARLLAARPLEPDDADALRRLFRLWMWLERPRDALAALDAHQARILADLGQRERAQAECECAGLRLDAAAQCDGAQKADLENCFSAAADAVAACAAAPRADDDESREGWERLLGQARRIGLPDGLERAARELHALLTRDPERGHWRAWDDACLQLRLGAAAQLRGNAAGARELALKALATLAQPASGQEVELDDWLRLAPEFAALAPDAVDLVVGQARKAIGPDPGPARFRDLEVRLSRLLAQAKWQLGERERALALARHGRFLLTSDEDDGFSAQVMDWLMATGREAEAASVALESAWHLRAGSGLRAVALAAERLAAADAPAPEVAGLWALTLAAAAMEDRLSEAVAQVLKRPAGDALIHELIERARAAAPAHPLAAALQGRELLGQGHPEQALPLLERLLDAPEWVNGDRGMELWLTRMRVHGPAKGMSERFVEAGSGHWCYALGVMLSESDEMMDKLELTAAQRQSFPADALTQLSTRYYEQAMTRFEAFFATGVGSARDGDIHTYSMNCNNLAICYRYEQKRLADALALHHKGLQSSPFAEHKLGVLWCHYGLAQYPEFVDAAEQLWHFSLDHGFSRHDPAEYFNEVAWAVQKLGRHTEIDIWLDRLRQWQGMLDGDDLKEQKPALLAVQASMLCHLQHHRPDDALARLQAIAPELLAIGRTYGLGRLADGLLAGGRPQEALAAYERAVQIFHPDHDGSQALERARDGVERARQALRKQRPWWRRWI